MLMQTEKQIRDWLTNGWIIEIVGEGSASKPRHESAAFDSTGEFWIGGGAPCALSFEEWERSSCAIWTPDFFTPLNESDAREGTAPFTTTWSRKINRDDLIAWLSGFEKTGHLSLSKVSWVPPQKQSFMNAFARLKSAFQEENLKKAVPVVFASGITATSDRIEWLRHRILAGLEGTAPNDLRLYGSWSADRGFLGATPESLFSRQGTTVASMAVAGTRAVSTLEDEDLAKTGLTSDRLAKFTNDFLNDSKERREHELVVQDIEFVLGQLAGKTGAVVEKGAIGVQRFGALFHLVTPLVARGSKALETRHLVEALHPTPALGLSPRDKDLRLLREIHDLGGDRIAREGFGAPFIVKQGDRVEALVAIRQIRWEAHGESDRLRIAVGSGCGVVAESDVDREWAELSAKRNAVMRLFRLSPEKSEPVFTSLRILSELLDFGVRHFVVCAGARNAPLVVAAEALRQASVSANGGTAPNARIRVESFFEERAAAFYALGVARASGRPVAVLTTSGTAVAELLPAMAEADFSGVPLVAVTADRPRRLRESGAPQSIPQNQIFQNFVERTWDLEDGDKFTGLSQLSRLRPLHVNTCFEEPLLADAELEPARLKTDALAILNRRTNESNSIAKTFSASSDPSVAFAALGTILAKRRENLNAGTVVIVGGLENEERQAVVDFIVGHGLPCLLEGPSGLRGDLRLKDLELRGGDRDLQRWCLTGDLGSVIRIGGVPTTRVWRDLDDPHVATQTLSISRLRFSGLGRGQFIHLPGPGELAEFLRQATTRDGRAVPSVPTSREASWLKEDRVSAEKLETILRGSGRSEPAFVRAFSDLVPSDAILYVGNSLPIRWWDLVANRNQISAVQANRGVNGIDGQLSTAFGLAKGGGTPRELWILVGDLTALYDLAAPWALLKNPSGAVPRVRIFVLNNSGGRIFTRVLAKAPGGPAPFENEHALNFEKWAEMWQLDYTRVDHPRDLEARASSLRSQAVVELRSSNEDTAKFWTELAK